MISAGSIEMGGRGSGVVFSVDTSGSFDVPAIVSVLNAYLAQSNLNNVALVSHSDYAVRVLDRTTGLPVILGLAATGDYGFRIDSGFTSPAGVAAATAVLSERYGGDYAESYTRIIYEMSRSDTQALLGGVPSSLVMFVDNYPHEFSSDNDVLDPGRAGDVGGNATVGYGSAVLHASSVSALHGAGCDLVIINADFYDSGIHNFWMSNSAGTDHYLRWDFSPVSLIAFLNDVF